MPTGDKAPPNRHHRATRLAERTQAAMILAGAPWPRRDLLVALLALVLVPDPTTAAPPPVRVASKIDTEGALLGNMILAALAARGIPTVDRLQLGPTTILRRAILAGEIDLYPDYTGNGAIFFSLPRDPAWHDAAAGYRLVRDLDAAANDLAWLRPAPADNGWAIAVPQRLAAAHGLAGMTDFARWVAGGGRVRLAASAEFVESPAALPALTAAYGFTLAEDQLVVLAGGNTAATERAAAEAISGVNAAMAYGTDGALAALGLVLMSDTKGAEIVYAPAPVVRGAALRARPQIAAALNRVFGALDRPTLQRLNARVSVDGEDAGAIARSWLAARGLLE